MRVIDARTGAEVREGSRLAHEPGWTYEILRIHPGILKASATVRHLESGKVSEQPLAVRWTHPSFFLQHVAFVPS